MIAAFALAMVALAAPCGTPRPSTDAAAPQNYVFFGRDHERIADTSFLSHPHN